MLTIMVLFKNCQLLDLDWERLGFDKKSVSDMDAE